MHPPCVALRILSLACLLYYPETFASLVRFLRAAQKKAYFCTALGTIRALESMQRLIFRMNVYHLKHPDFQRREDQRSGKFSNNNNLLGSNLASRKKNQKNQKTPKAWKVAILFPKHQGALLRHRKTSSHHVCPSTKSSFAGAAWDSICSGTDQ